MERTLAELAEAAHQLAVHLPLPLLESLAHALQQLPPAASWSHRRNAVVQLPLAVHREAAAQFFDHWQQAAPALSAEAVALALLTAAHTAQMERNRVGIEIAWTGPLSGSVPLRQTEQSLLQLLRVARRRLMLVSYAVYRIPSVRGELIAAADRGVDLRIVLESPDPSAGENAYSTLKALGSAVAARSSIYYWPMEKRAADEDGHKGSLHVKCAIADGERLFVSSANLTEYAFTLNMELGLIIHCTETAREVESHFEKLIETGVLVRVQ